RGNVKPSAANGIARRTQSFAAVIEPTVRIKRIVTEQFVHATVKAVGARLGDKVFDCAGRPAVFSGEGSRLDLEFLQGLNRRRLFVKGRSILTASLARAVDHDLVTEILPTANFGDKDSVRATGGARSRATP